MEKENPLSPKVLGGLTGAGVGAGLSDLVLWILGSTLWGGGYGAEEAKAAIAAVPYPVATIITLGMAMAGALLLGYSLGDPFRVTGADIAASEERDHINEDLAAAGLSTLGGTPAEGWATVLPVEGSVGNSAGTHVHFETMSKGSDLPGDEDDEDEDEDDNPVEPPELGPGRFGTPAV